MLAGGGCWRTPGAGARRTTPWRDRGMGRGQGAGSSCKRRARPTLCMPRRGRGGWTVFPPAANPSAAQTNAAVRGAGHGKQIAAAPGSAAALLDAPPTRRSSPPTAVRVQPTPCNECVQGSINPISISCAGGCWARLHARNQLNAGSRKRRNTASTSARHSSLSVTSNASMFSLSCSMLVAPMMVDVQNLRRAWVWEEVGEGGVGECPAAAGVACFEGSQDDPVGPPPKRTSASCTRPGPAAWA